MKSRHLLILILLTALLVRLPHIIGSFWMDEASQALESMRPWYQQLSIEADFQPPLYHLLVFPLVHISTQEWWVRLASLIPGLATVWFTYGVGVELAIQMKKTIRQQRMIGFVSAILLGISAYHVFYSQELRQYVLSALFGIASWYTLLRVLRSQSHARHHKLWPIFFVLSTTLGFYSMYVYPFLTAAQFLYVCVYHRSRIKPLLYYVFLSTVLFLPWIPGFLQQLRVGTTLQQSLPGWAEVVSFPQWKALPLVALKFLGGGKAIDATWIDAVYFGLPLLGILMLWLKHRRAMHPSLYFWCGISVLFAWMVSFVIPVIQPKRVLFALPGMYIGIAQLIVEIRNKNMQRLIIIAAICYQLIGLGILWTTPSLQREDWRSMVATMHQRFSPTDTYAIFGFTAPFSPWNFYELQYSRPFSAAGFPKMPVLTQKDVDATLQKTLLFHRVLVFDYLRDLTDPNRQIEAWLTAHGYSGVASIDTTNIGFIRVYEKTQYANTRDN